MRSRLLLGGLFVVAGCSLDWDGLRARNNADSAVVDTGSPPEDTGFPDVPLDTGMADTGVMDTGVTDTGQDTGTPDTGVMDTGRDTGVMDTGRDTGVMDTGFPDTGFPDTGFPDTGFPDTGFPDTGFPDTGVDAGTVTELWVVRVGSGTGSLSNSSAPVFLERRSAVDGSMTGAPIALPTSMSGSNRPFTLSGTSTSEGALSRSSDGRYLLLAGYGVAPGQSDVAGSSVAVAPRVIARVAGDGTVNTTTTLELGLSAANARTATSTDGTTLWAGGSAGGTYGTTLGSTSAPTVVAAMPNNVRTLGVFGGQLYGSSGSTPFVGVFQVGTGTPTTTGVTATLLPGFSSVTGLASYGFAMLDRVASVPGVDTLYVADERNPASGGGVQRWTLSGGTWTLGATFSSGLSTVGVRGVTAWIDGDDALIAATTGETSPRLLLYRDRPGMSPGAPTVLATAPGNTFYRGVALAPAR